MTNPYEAPESDVAQQRPPQYVGFWLRFLAVIIDTLLLMIVLYPIARFVFGMENLTLGMQIPPPTGTTGVSVGLQYVLPAVVIIVFWVYRSATPGKIIIGAKIVDAKTGGKPSTGQFIGRYLAYYLSSLILCLGFLWAAWDPRKQGWHDKLAGTAVVKEGGHG